MMKSHQEREHLLAAGENQAWTTSNYFPPCCRHHCSHIHPLLLHYRGRGVPPPFSWRYINLLPTCSDLHIDHSPISRVFKGSPSSGSFPSIHECDQIPPILVKNMFLDLPSPSSYHLRSCLTISSKCFIRIKYTYCPINSNDTTPAKAMDVLLMAISSGQFASCT